MQEIYFNNSTLTVTQRFFIQKSLEMVYYHTIDSYRVKVKNPKSILYEIKSCLDAFEAKQIKHFGTIAGDNKTLSLNNEALNFLKIEPNYIQFTSISKPYFEDCLRNLSELSYKKCRKAIEMILDDNTTYLDKLLDGLDKLLDENYANNEELLTIMKNIDITVGYLFAELVEIGFSKGFLYKKIQEMFLKNLHDGTTFKNIFSAFIQRIKQTENEYAVIFRVNCGKKIISALENTTQRDMEVLENVNSYLPDETQLLLYTTTKKQAILNELNKFNVVNANRKYLKCTIHATDHVAALKKAKSILSQNIDIINIGFSDEFIYIHNKVLLVENGKPHNADFQNTKYILDGKYTASHDYYSSFIDKLPNILTNAKIPNENKEKVKSALRYLRLGNESIEVEHKFINYWIGLEYLFSNYESTSTISRIKEHFINAHCLVYVKRNINAFLKDFESLPKGIKENISEYDNISHKHKSHENFYQDVYDKLINKNPLLAYRSIRLKEKLFSNTNNSSIKKYIHRHRDNLLIHFTRIYRMRNEIVHDAITDSNYEQIASNLKYYLTFILNGIIDYLYNSTNSQSIEDYFIMNEIHLGNIEREGFPLDKLLEIDASINFIS